jgi:hypothetical protein
LQAEPGDASSGTRFWLKSSRAAAETDLSNLKTNRIEPEVLATEEEVGRAQLEEIKAAVAAKSGDLVLVLLGGRGAQAMYRLVGELAQTSALDDVLGRLHVFTQDALAPLRMDNPLNFVSDFRRLLGDSFFRKIKSFTPMRTDVTDLQGDDQLHEKLESLGGIDLFWGWAPSLRPRRISVTSSQVPAPPRQTSPA